MRYIGIDIGDGESCVALLEENSVIEPAILPINGQGSIISVVGMSSTTVKVGEEALLDPRVVHLRSRFKSRYLTTLDAERDIERFAYGIKAALEKEEQTGAPATAIELPDGTVLTGKTSNLLGSASAMLINALKHLAGISDDIMLISPVVIEPIQNMKVDHLRNKNPLLHTDEVLIALSICAATNPTVQLALSELRKLKGSEVHSSVLLSEVDINTFKCLGINVTCEPKHENNKLYHK